LLDLAKAFAEAHTRSGIEDGLSKFGLGDYLAEDLAKIAKRLIDANTSEVDRILGIFHQPIARVSRGRADPSVFFARYLKEAMLAAAQGDPDDHRAYTVKMRLFQLLTEMA
jgi:hypothetical protein